MDSPAFAQAVALRASPALHTSLDTTARRPTLPRHHTTAPARRSARTTTPTALFGKLWNNDDSAGAKFGFAVGYSYLAHPEKQTGEDAFFIEDTSIGVFDGVSGAYETRGVDPRLYSQYLAALTRDNVRELGPGSVVKAAIEAAASNDQVGASTACVVGMDRVGRLFGINLGDSGVRLFRDGKMIFRTKEQQHFFNCPYQLGTDSQDGLAMGQNIQKKVRIGDTLVVATDGLFDNMSDAEMLEYVAQTDDAMTLAETLGEVASTRGTDKSFVSPFMNAAIQAGQKWQGGKADDVTVVVAKVVDSTTATPESLLSTIPEVDA